MVAISERGSQDPLSALSWVKEELRRSLELANKALRRYLKEAEQLSDLDTIDPGVLRQARSQIHQSVGVLDLVGLGRAAEVLRAAEAALQRMSARPKLITVAAVDTLERGSFALLEFIDRKLADKPVSTLSLFPQYRALQELAGVTRAHPADLWGVEWAWRELVLDVQVAPRHPNEDTLNRIEADLLGLMRGAPPSVASRMSELFAGLAAGAQATALASDAGGAGGSGDVKLAGSLAAPHARLATLWQLAAGFFEAQSDGLLTLDTYSKRVGSKLLTQLRAGEGAAPSERLALDLLFFCAQAAPRGNLGVGPRLAAVHAGYKIVPMPPVEYENARLGRFDPNWVAQARKRVVAAKEVWSAVAGGDVARLSGLSEQFTLVADSLARLYPDGDQLGRSLQVAAAHATALNLEPPAALAMEVATALLYLEASLDDGDFDHADGGDRIRRLAQRIDAVRQARDPGMLELWMEELYRRVSDRQTMGSVVQELRASLSEVEKNIDLYFRNPAQRELLIPVPAQLSAMRGVLSVLGLDHASQAVLRMRDDVDALANTEVNPQRAIEAGTFDRLADNLGALSFLIDMVSVQPQMAKSLFRFDPQAGALTAVMAREDRPTGFDDPDTQTAPDPEAYRDTDAMAVTLEFDRILRKSRAAQRGGGGAALPEPAAALSPHGLPMLSGGAGFVGTGSGPDVGEFGHARTLVMPGPLSAPAAADLPARPATPPTSVSNGLEDDPEMREVFLDEAREVLITARAALGDLQHRHDDGAAMTSVRRAFHTLKGSARMVGLPAFGEASWACEQLYNARLAEPDAQVDAALRQFSLEACQEFERWVQALENGDATAFSPDRWVQAAEQLRHAHAAAALTPQPVSALTQRVPDLPSASDLDLRPDLPLPSDSADAEIALPTLDLTALDDHALTPLPAVADLDLSLDLGRPGDAVTVLRHAGDSAAADNQIDFDLGDATSPAVDLNPDELVPVSPAPAPFQPDRTLVLDRPAPGAATTPQHSLGVAAQPTAAEGDSEAFRQIGLLRIGLPLFNIYLNEADELSRRLGIELAEWALEQHLPVAASAVSLAHSLAGNSAAVGYTDLAQLARELEHALGRSRLRGHGLGDEPHLFSGAAAEIRRLLHLFAAGFLNAPDAKLLSALRDWARASPVSTPPSPLDSPGQRPADAAAAEAGAGAGFPPARPDALAGLSAPAAAAAGPATGLGRAALLPFAARPQAESSPHRITEAAAGFDEDIDQRDSVDDELFPYFVEEAQELLPLLHARLREWAQRPAERDAASACMRSLHTFKGGARLAGAMRLGELAHRLETGVERLTANPDQVSSASVEVLIGHADVLEASFDALRQAPLSVPAPVVTPAPAAIRPAAAAAVKPALQAVPVPVPVSAGKGAKRSAPASVARPATGGTAAGTLAVPLPAPLEVPIDWQRFAVAPGAARPEPARPVGLASAGSVRVRAPLLDRLVNHAGEVSITRARIESDVNQLKSGLGDLSDNLERLRSQLRDIELQAETQIGSRMEAARVGGRDFDPLEMDRFTRFQELTRMMAESVADVATVQRGLQRTLQSSEDALAHQARMTRDMQDDLLRTRMVEFEGLSERLYRVVRQAAKETVKSVRLDIIGGSIEIDRGVLDRMLPAFEHLLRNSVVHGIESSEVRIAAGKDAVGTITMAVAQVGNEVAVEVRDDGAGLNLPRVRDKALAMGLITADEQPDDAALANLIFHSGVSTASVITDLAGRGVGMDVVRTDVNAMGGRIETASAPGQGTSIRLVLPLTTAVTQVVMLRCGDRTVAVPSTLVELVRRLPLAELATAYQRGQSGDGAAAMPFFWLDALLNGTPRGEAAGRTAAVVVIRSAAQRVMLHVDEVIGNQEVVVKNLGPQLSRVPGLVGMTLLPSGRPALIYNPVALATLYGDDAHQATAAAQAARLGTDAALAAGVGAFQPVLAPLVLVVDDSLTVRRITQRLLEREGYRVTVAKDGLDGLDKLSVEAPAVLLTDIEMPRMDGFDLVRNMRTDQRLAQLPVIMITSRIAQKHRDYAAELGVDHYLGKPYVEEELLRLVARYARRSHAH